MWRTTFQFASGREILTVDGQCFPPKDTHVVIDGRVYESKKIVLVPKALLVIVELNLVL